MKGGKGCWYGEADYELHPTLWTTVPKLPDNVARKGKP